jgi:prepilin-type N-terminal cleavage/methylation domain-containing protein
MRNRRSTELKLVNQSGFSLLELSIALTILTILSVGLSSSLSKVNDFDKYAENRIILQKNYSAFLTFVQANGFLPCPDTDGNGLENRENTFQCTSKNGQVPYQDLGIPFGDVWGQPLHYSVNNQADDASGEVLLPAKSASYFSNQPGAQHFDINTPPFGSNPGTGYYTVCNELEAASCTASTPSSAKSGFSVIAVVISYGKNGAQTWAGNASSVGEIENSDNDNYFWQAKGSNVAADEFDDQLFWLTGYDVKYASLKSGRVIQ